MPQPPFQCASQTEFRELLGFATRGYMLVLRVCQIQIQINMILIIQFFFKVMHSILSVTIISLESEYP